MSKKSHELEDEIDSHQIATTAVPAVEAKAKNVAAQALGQMGGLRRAALMPPERRSEIAREAAKRRWSKP